MDDQYHTEALEIEIQRISREQHELEQRLHASRIALDRALLALAGQSPERSATGLGESERSDKVPRLSAPKLRGIRFAGVIVVLVLVALVLTLGRRWRADPAGASGRIGESTVAKVPAPASAAPSAFDRAVDADHLVLHVRARRECWVRIGIDNEDLDERRLRDGDELILRPRAEIVLQTDDAGALAAALNGRSIRLGRDGDAGTFRITPQNVEQFLSDAGRGEGGDTGRWGR